MTIPSSLSIFRRKVSKSYETISAAYHESGHAICSLLRHMKIESASIYEDKKIKQICGLTIFYPYDLKKFNQHLANYFLISEIYINYAGLVVEKIFYKKISGSDKFPSFLKDGSSHDTREAAKLLKKLSFISPGRQRFLYKRKLTNQLSILLESYWSDIELIAHALIQKKKINFNQIKSLLLRKSNNKVFWRQRFKSINYVLRHENDPLDDQTVKIIINV